MFGSFRIGRSSQCNFYFIDCLALHWTKIDFVSKRLAKRGWIGKKKKKKKKSTSNKLAISPASLSASPSPLSRSANLPSRAGSPSCPSAPLGLDFVPSRPRAPTLLHVVAVALAALGSPACCHRSCVVRLTCSLTRGHLGRRPGHAEAWAHHAWVPTRSRRRWLATSTACRAAGAWSAARRPSAS
jgi:hypothetical protein